MTSRFPLKEGVQIIRGYVNKLTSAPGVYRMFDEHGTVLYVGKAKNLKRRVTSYTQPEKQTIRIQRMIASTQKMEFVTTHTEAEALLLEVNLIKSLKPRYNILFRDDKSFPYILLTKGSLPSCLRVHRGSKTEKGEYFGPFASRQSVGKTLDILTRVFKLRTCIDSLYNNRKRPCLQYHIKRCTAPCVQYVSEETYTSQVDQAHQFLLGKTQSLQKTLAKKMEYSSKERLYEQAKELRDQIQALTKIQEEQGIFVSGIENVDVVSVARAQDKVAVQIFLFRNGTNYGSRSYFPKHNSKDTDEDILEAFLSWFYATEDPPKEVLLNIRIKEKDSLQQMLSDRLNHSVHLTVPQRGLKFQVVQQAYKNALESLALKLADLSSIKKLLEGVAEVFGLPKSPKRIEVYDNSHSQGKEAYGAMIVATQDGFDKKSYRKFSIKNTEAHIKGGDDYAMMREVLARRFKKANSENFPDLIILDGGKGQLSSGLAILQELGLTHIPIMAIAKGPDRNAGRETFHLPNQPMVSLEKDSPILYYLQRLRDESHRFVIGTHRHKKKKMVQRSKLDDIKGVGSKRKKELLQRFGSVKAISEAGIADLKKVEGISQAMAKIVYDFFH